MSEPIFWVDIQMTHFEFLYYIENIFKFMYICLLFSFSLFFIYLTPRINLY